MTTKTEYHKKPQWLAKLKFFADNGYKINQPKHGDSIFTILGQEEHTRFINLDNCKNFILPSGQKKLLLPGRAARYTLEEFYPHGFEAWGGYRDVRKSPPMWLTDRVKNVDGHYFDFISAYWIISRRLWLDILYPHCLKTKSHLPIDICLDWLYFWKEARNGLLGLTYSNQQIRWYNENNKRIIKTIYTSNKFFNPCLWAVVNEILHDIAHIATRLGCLFIATDGYIFPNKTGFKFAEILDKMGLHGYYRHYHGKINIRGWGAYKIEGYNVHTNKSVEKFTDRFSEYTQREAANPKDRKFKIKMSLPIYKKARILRVSHYKREKNYEFLTWWASLNEPLINTKILDNRKEKINE